MIYCGTQVRGYPVKWESRNGTDRIVFQYDLLEGSSWIKLAEISLYPFKRGELIRLLQEAGFVDIQIFADLEPVPDLKDEKVSAADFLTYVAHKVINAKAD